MAYKMCPPVDGVEIIKLNFLNCLGRGATGEVYKLKVREKYYAVKIYHNKTNFNHEKIQFMILNSPETIYVEEHGDQYPLYSWPLSVIFQINDDRKEDPIGFIMPLIDEEKSKTLEYFYDFTLSKRLSSQLSNALSFKIKILENLCHSIASLHQKGILLIDLKPQNMRVFEGTNIVTLLDCDSYKITDNSKKIFFSGEMVSPGYISPELFKANLSPVAMGITQDLYALAVIIFQVLNKGIHPFQGILNDDKIVASTNDEKSAAGLYPYGINSNPKINPKKESLHETFLPITRVLFDRAFIESKDRPSATEWTQHFHEILKDKHIVRCKQFPNDINHMHFREMPCPMCLSHEKARTEDIYNQQGNLILDLNKHSTSVGTISKINSFEDIQHIYGIPSNKDYVKKSSWIMPLFLISISILGLVIILIYANTEDDKNKLLSYIPLSNNTSLTNSNKSKNENNSIKSSTNDIDATESVEKRLFRCFGVYSNVVKGEDWSGLEVNIRSTNKIFVKYYEGTELKANAKNIQILNNEIRFDIDFGDGSSQEFIGTCSGRKIKYEWQGSGGVLKKIK